MPIEFHCPGCGKLMRTPNETAGRKGQCPTCGVHVMIPAQSSDSARSQRTIPKPAPATTTLKPPQHAKQESIEFHCSHCHKAVKVPATAAGKQGQCPHCKNVMLIPVKSVGIESKPALKPVPSSVRTPQTSAPTGLVPIPTAKLKPRDKSGLVPLDSSDLTPIPNTGLTPISNSGLTPIGNSGLTPISNSGLTPIKNSGLTPLKNSGLTPIGTPSPASSDLIPLDAFPTSSSNAVLPSNPFSDFREASTASINPYISPSVASPALRVRRNFDDSKRRGLPWDREDEDNAFFGTMGRLLNTVGDAYSEMRCTGGVLKPLAFALLSHLMCIGIGLMVLLIVFAVAVSTGRELPAVMRNMDREDMGALLFGILFVLFYVVGVLGCVAVSTFVWSGLMHSVLLLFGQAQRKFETTFRVYCYALGTAIPLSLIPVVGLVAIVVYFVLLVKGLSRCHEISTGTAFSAAIIPPMLWIGIVISLVVMLDPP